MFPIPWNFPFRKKDGTVVNVEDAISGGGGSALPDYDSEDAGKVLGVDENGELEWSNEVPAYVEADAGKLLSVDDSGDLEWSDKVPKAIQDLSDEVDGGWYKGRNLWNDSNVSGTETVTVTLKNPLPAGTYTISAIVVSSDTDADTCLIYDVTNSATLGQIARSTENDRVAITFTTANAIADIRFYASNSFNGSQGDTFSFTNIQIEKGETATKYVPYAMTNRELTDAVVPEPITITPATGITIDYNLSYKIGNLAVLNFRFLIGNDVTVAANLQLATISAKPKALNGTNSLLGNAYKTWEGSFAGIVDMAASTGILKLSTAGSFAAGGYYYLSMAYICE